METRWYVVRTFSGHENKVKTLLDAGLEENENLKVKISEILVPMEKVFEDFVAAKLSRQFTNWKIRTQVGGQALIDRHLGRKRFNLYPDLELRQGQLRLEGVSVAQRLVR